MIMIPERTLQYIYDLALASKLGNINLLDGKRKRALDVGCGKGYGLLALKALGHEVYGFDVDGKAVRIAKSMGFKNVTIANLEEGIPYQTYFHLITCFGVLEHVRRLDKALKALLATSFDVLVITVPNIKTEFLRLTYLVLRKGLRVSITRGKGFLIKDPDHVNMMGPKQWLRNIRSRIQREGNLQIYLTTYFQLCWRNECIVLEVPYVGSSIMITVVANR